MRLNFSTGLQPVKKKLFFAIPFLSEADEADRKGKRLITTWTSLKQSTIKGMLVFWLPRLTRQPPLQRSKSPTSGHEPVGSSGRAANDFLTSLLHEAADALKAGKRLGICKTGYDHAVVPVRALEIIAT